MIILLQASTFSYAPRQVQGFYGNKGKIWLLMSTPKPTSANIAKFENLGTLSFCIEQSIHEAINFHLALGPQCKQEYLHFLKLYRVELARQIPSEKFHTLLNPKFSCAIARVSKKGLTPQQLDQR